MQERNERIAAFELPVVQVQSDPGNIADILLKRGDDFCVSFK